MNREELTKTFMKKRWSLWFVKKIVSSLSVTLINRGE